MELESDETILFEGHPSWRGTLAFLFRGIAIVLLVAGVVALVGAIADWNWLLLAVLILIVGVVVVTVIGYVLRLFVLYRITSHRLYIRRGVISRHEQATQLRRVQNVNTNQTAFQRLLHVGNVDFDTAGSDDFEFRFLGVADPNLVVAAVHRAQRADESSTPV